MDRIMAGDRNFSKEDVQKLHDILVKQIQYLRQPYGLLSGTDLMEVHVLQFMNSRYNFQLIVDKIEELGIEWDSNSMLLILDIE